MECLHAQGLVSAAVDGDAVDRIELETAKDHCRDCTECIRFVHALALAKRAGAPTPPPDLADRIVAAVSADADARDTELAAAEAGATAAQPVTEPEAVPTADTTAQEGTEAAPVGFAWLSDRLRSSNTSAVIAWASAAAVLLVFAGWAAIAGVRTILAPPAVSDVTEMREFGTATVPEKEGSGASPESAVPGEEDAASVAEQDAAAETAQYITFEGAVYGLAGSSGATTATLQPTGTTLTALDTDDPPANRVVYKKRTGELLYLADDQGTLLAFAPTTRTFKSVTYHLQSGPISSFGVWPTLPPAIEPPTQPDGSPTFTPAGQDGDVDIFRLTGGSVGQGVAIAPGSPPDDPASGNPDWTWWTPVR
jgi:hypothetical protein